jgi:hypothetical protein
VVGYEVLRRVYDPAGSAPFAPVWKGNSLTFSDSTVTGETAYEYVVQARDDAGLPSEVSMIVAGKKLFPQTALAVSGLQAVYDSVAHVTRLVWTYTPPQIPALAGQEYRFFVFRAWGPDPLQEYAELTATTLAFTDTKVGTPGTYTYGVQVVYASGRAGNMTKATAPVRSQEP